jgi:hypothetical protein
MKRAAAALVAAMLLGLSGRLIDFPALAMGFKGDEATYVSMAFSLVEDQDLAYTQADLLRFNRIYGPGRGGRPVGPDGIFLKAGPRPTSEALQYAKAFAYPLFAAPFVWLGGLGGMFMFNVALVGLCAWCAVEFAAMRVGKAWGWAIGVLFIGASSLPTWTAFLMPEVFNYALIFVAYFLWAFKFARGPERQKDDFFDSPWSDVAAALVIALAAYSKPTNAPLVAPIVVTALWRRQWRHALVVSVAFFAAFALWFGANRAITGEFNYQGGARKTFVGAFPFDAQGSTFENAANSGANATGTDSEQQVTIHPDILFPGEPHFATLFATNAGYFLWGRDSGLIPYYFPAALIAGLWLLRIRRAEHWQLAAAAFVTATALFMLFWWPYTWNGAGGPPGNRYFVSAVPALFFLLPTGLGAGTAIASGLGGILFMWPLFAHPFLSAKEPWHHPAAVPLRYLPVERTMMNDIPIRLNPRKSRIPFGDPRNAMLWFMDPDAYDGERIDGREGYWIAGGESTEIIVRTAFRPAAVELVVTTPIANGFTAWWGDARCDLALEPGIAQRCELATDDAVWAKGAYYYDLVLRTTAGFVPKDTNPGSADTRNLGAFVAPVFKER